MPTPIDCRLSVIAMSSGGRHYRTCDDRDPEPRAPLLGVVVLDAADGDTARTDQRDRPEFHRERWPRPLPADWVHR